MSKKQDRMVFQTSEGNWANKRNDATRASTVHTTQREAEQVAKQMLKNQGGGELTTKGTNGLIRSKDTIAPGNDPRSIKDKEH